MTSHRLINILAAIAVVALFAAIQHQDALDEIKHAKAHTVALADAQIAAARALRRDMAAAALCREEHGEAGYAWTEAGALVCIPRKGKYRNAGVTLAKAVQP